MERHKTCSFFGHRKVVLDEVLKQKVIETIEDLIINHDVSIFLFGSRSEFDYICHLIVNDIKEKYPYIKRIAYTCKNESCTLISESKKWKEILSGQILDIILLDVEEDFEHSTKYSAGRASYIERNKAMIDDSDFCVFYYDETYRPQLRKHSKRSIGFYQPKSGTALAYNYATKKKKTIINVLNNPKSIT